MAWQEDGMGLVTAGTGVFKGAWSEDAALSLRMVLKTVPWRDGVAVVSLSDLAGTKRLVLRTGSGYRGCRGINGMEVKVDPECGPVTLRNFPSHAKLLVIPEPIVSRAHKRPYSATVSKKRLQLLGVFYGIYCDVLVPGVEPFWFTKWAFRFWSKLKGT